MSQENVDLFLKTIDAWNRDDVEAYVEVVHPEGEFHPGASLVQEAWSLAAMGSGNGGPTSTPRSRC